MHTRKGTRLASPVLVALVMLACCWLTILPGVQIDSDHAIDAAMQEGIDSRWLRVKKKISNAEINCKRVLFWRGRNVLQQMRRANESERHAGGKVMPTVCDHAGQKIFSQ